MSENEVGLAIAVDISHPASFRVIAVGNEMALPQNIRLLGIFVPP